MKRIGLIGGLGPEATIEYYNGLINAFKDGSGDLNYPEIIIYSVNMSEFMALMTAKKYDELTAVLLEKIDSLKRAGAEFAAMTANTPHLVFDRVKERSPLPLISIVEATREEASRKRHKACRIVGHSIYYECFFLSGCVQKHGIEVVTPDQEDKDLINIKLFSEIELGIFKDETRELLIGIIHKMVEQQNIDSIILGCTEFPLILTEQSYAGVPVLNTTSIHIRKIANYCSGIN